MRSLPEVDADKLDPGELCGRIELDDISFRYNPDGPLLLDDVSLRIELRVFIGTYSVPSVHVSVECWAVGLAREKGEPMVPQEWVGKRVEVDLVRPGPTLMGATYQGMLNAVTDLGIVATLSTDDHPGIEERERFYPWSAVLSIDLSG